jgi:hypothetical protein
LLSIIGRHTNFFVTLPSGLSFSHESADNCFSSVAELEHEDEEKDDDDNDEEEAKLAQELQNSSTCSEWFNTTRDEIILFEKFGEDYDEVVNKVK